MLILPHTPSDRLEGRRALVTGATSGIGLGAAVALAELGAHVVISARGAGKLEAVEKAMTAAGFAVSTLPLDVADSDATSRAVEANGPFDVLVNSAGLARHSPAVDTTPDAFDAVSDLNFRGAYFLAAAVAKGLILADRPGSIITISSQMGHVGGPDRAVYAATKHAVEGFTKAMAIEWGPRRIRVNTIGPTFVRTPLTDATFADPQKVRWINDKIKLGRVGEVEDIMGAVAYLASDRSAMVTGTALLVDGGWTAG